MRTSDEFSVLRERPFSDAVANLEELLFQGRRAFLIGAGCSKCADLPLTTELTTLVLRCKQLDVTSKAILKAIKNEFNGAKTSNIEDYLSELVDLLAIADRRDTHRNSCGEVRVGGTPYLNHELRLAAEQIKKTIANEIKKPVEIETHRAFVRAVHRPTRPGKATVGPVVDYLVLNYDTVVEDALAIERIAYSDGMDGGVTGWWNPETFNRRNLAARVFKLHGSVDWCRVADDPLPRRIGPNLEIQDMQHRHILIWPASTKYRETQLDPFAQLTDHARAVMRPTPSSQRVLAICGYSFGDPHINLEIDRALRKSAGGLTVIVFSGEDEPVGQLKEWNEAVEVQDQVLIFSRRGFFHGTAHHRAKQDLPWWKFENVVRLIEGKI